MEIDSVPAIKQIVEQGHLNTILTYGAVHAEIAMGRLTVTPLPIRMQALIVAATPKHRAESKTPHALLRIVSAEIKRFWPKVFCAALSASGPLRSLATVEVRTTRSSMK